MLKALKSALQALRIFDSDGTLSLTSIVLMAATFKFLVTPSCDTETLIALLGAITAYQAKKVINNQAVSTDVSDKVAGLEAKMSSLGVSVQTVLNRTAPGTSPVRR